MNIDSLLSDSRSSTMQHELAHHSTSILDAANGKAGSLHAWNNKKFRDEYDAMKSRLSDTKYTITDYPDPLLPRSAQQSKSFVPSPAPEVEARLKKQLRQIQAMQKEDRKEEKLAAGYVSH